MAVEVHVVRVSSGPDGKHGNPLGIVDAAAVVDDAERQALAKHLGFSETVFVDLPDPGTRTARARIFTPAAELPFAGHPTVGLAWWLDDNGLAVDALEVPAGRVETRARHGATWVRSQPDWAPEFTIHPMPHVEDVVHARAHDFTSGHHYVWAWEDELEGRIRSRMFAPDLGIAEDEATGSAAVRITAHLRRALLIVQGRGSRIHTTWGDDGTVEIGGLVRAERRIVA
ncbi:PhzF family phenazine biosynthesis protein [Prescottella agglutinans]|uniref:PhzF family phenazine biosynthesis protein n=1 Tax=Prescottella agglutinans TaxID=1644129 RepID=A0A3S3EBW9_9NOCA|nr:PhzF family phenazine biosynthesis protein [Prescottella agglutinans]RVW09915.1 PhzF family phenazine biosynthesis protein [Prescottella agglutinans]